MNYFDLLLHMCNNTQSLPGDHTPLTVGLARAAVDGPVVVAVVVHGALAVVQEAVLALLQVTVPFVQEEVSHSSG